MAISYHIRSNSFPSKPHPFTTQFNEHLNRLKSSESTSTSSSQGLNGLQDLYDCVDDLLQLQLTQQSLAQEQNKDFVQELLDGSLVLLDVCSIAKDSLLQIKESGLELQSVLRRRRGGEFGFDEIKKYMNFRKLIKKAINKTLKILKVKEICIANEDHEDKSAIKMLKEAEQVTLTVFRSLLSFVLGPKTWSKQSSWSVVFKLMQSHKISCEKDLSEFQKVDAALVLLYNKKRNKFDNIFEMQNQLKDLQMCIQDLEEGIESLSRRLIKTRVCLLNSLNN